MVRKRRKSKKIIASFWVILFVFSLFIGFSYGNADNKGGKIKNKDISKKLSDEEIMKILFSKDNYRYNPNNKPDPFKPFGVEEKRGPQENLSPLERLDLAEIKLVGIIDTPHGKLALIEDGTGRGYFIKVGSKIGHNNGIVTKIDSNAVYIEEKIKDFLGRIVNHKIVLKLRPAED